MAKYHYYEWTNEDDRKLSEIMLSAAKMKVDERFRKAAENLGRTAKSCQNRWYEIRSRDNEAV